MTSTTLTPYRSGRAPGRDGFAQLLRAEWTKFRTVRGWLIALIGAAVLAALATIAIGGTANGTQNPGAQNPGATGPNGEAVTDQFEFAHQSLAGNGSLTVAVKSLTRQVQTPPGGLSLSLADAVPPGPQPWTKAGIIIKASMKPGSAYAAVMVTGSHGVRMQYDYTHDIAGQGGAPSAAAPAWLRLTRSGQTITGYDSADGTHWTRIGMATLTGLPSTVPAGMFAASPDVDVTSQGFASNNGIPLGTFGTGTFGQVRRQGDWLASSWSDSHVGGSGGAAKVKISCGPGCARKVQAPLQAGLRVTGGTYRVTGTGDIAPYVPILDPLGLSFKGTLVGLIAVIALAALFITVEYRRGMIRTTFAASPHRGRVLAAKALVVGTVTFVAGLAGAAGALVGAAHKLRTSGWGEGVFPGVAAAERPRPADGGGNRRAVRAGRDPGGGSRGHVAPQCRCDHGRHRRPDRPADPGHAAADGACSVAAAAHSCRRLQRAARDPVLLPGDPRVSAVQRLLPAVAVARIRGARDLGRARAGRCHVGAPAEGRVSAGRHAQLAEPVVALATAGPAAGRTAEAGGWLAGFAAALHAEWTKLRTVPSTAWLLATAIVVTVAGSAVTVSVVQCSSKTCGADPVKNSLIGVMLGQAAIAVLAVMVVSGEYSSGMIRTSLTAVPRRAAMLAAKASVLTGAVLVTAAVAVLGSLLAGQHFTPGNGFTAAHGFLPVTLAHGPVVRAAAGSVLYFGLIALLSLGLAAALADSVVASTLVLGLL